MTILFNNVHQTARVLFFSPVCGGFCPFHDYQTARGQPLWRWQHFSSRKPILFYNITMHLLHSCTQCHLYHASSILHNSRDNVTWSSFSVGRAMEASIPNCTVYITRMHGGNSTEDCNKNLVENRFLLIMWKKPPGYYCCTHCDLDHSSTIMEVRWSSISVREGDGGMIRNCRRHITIMHAATTLKMPAKNLVESQSFLIMWTKPPGFLLYLLRIWGLLAISRHQNSRGQPPRRWENISSQKPILLYNIIRHLLHSSTQCDLDHACSILHKSRVTLT